MQISYEQLSESIVPPYQLTVDDILLSDMTTSWRLQTIVWKKEMKIEQYELFG